MDVTDGIAQSFSEIAAASSAGIVLDADSLPVHDVFRADEPAPSLPVDAALANAPARRGDFYGVPAVLD